MRNKNEGTLFERFVAAGSYLTLGTIGMIWFIVNALVVKAPMSKYLTTNLVQSFVLSIIYAIVTLIYNTFIGLLASIPFIGKLFTALHVFIFQTPVYHTMSLIHFILVVFLIYLSLISLIGKLPYVPYITDVSKKIYG